MSKLIKFDDFKKEEEEKNLNDLKKTFTKNSNDNQQYPRNTKYHYNDITKKMDDLSADEVDDKIKSIEESKVNESNDINDLKNWLKKKEMPLKKGTIGSPSGNYRMVDANVLLNYIQKNYTLTKKSKINESSIDYDILNRILGLPCYSKLREDFKSSISDFTECVEQSEIGYDEGSTDQNMAFNNAVQQAIDEIIGW